MSGSSDETPDERDERPREVLNALRISQYRPLAYQLQMYKKLVADAMFGCEDARRSATDELRRIAEYAIGTRELLLVGTRGKLPSEMMRAIYAFL